MKQDIGETISKALKYGSDRDAARALLEWLAQRVDESTADWDEGAGENWGRLIQGQRVVAFLSMRAPLAIVAGVPDEVTAELAARGVLLVRVDDVDSRVLCSDREAVTLLAGRPVSHEFDPREFSAEDLVWATL